MPNLNLENTLKHLDALRGTITTIEEPLRANLPPTRAVEAAKELSAIGREHFDAYLKTFADHDDTLTSYFEPKRLGSPHRQTLSCLKRLGEPSLRCPRYAS